MPGINLITHRTDAISATLLTNAGASDLAILRVTCEVQLHVFRDSGNCRRVAFHYFQRVLVPDEGVHGRFVSVRLCLVASLLGHSAGSVLVFGQNELVTKACLGRVMDSFALFPRSDRYFIHVPQDGGTVQSLTIGGAYDDLITRVARDSGIAVKERAINATNARVYTDGQERQGVVRGVGLLRYLIRFRTSNNAHQASILR